MHILKKYIPILIAIFKVSPYSFSLFAVCLGLSKTSSVILSCFQSNVSKKHEKLQGVI